MASIILLVLISTGARTNIARAQGQGNCSLALVLAIDASSSVNPQEYELQQKGLASALISPEVMQAIIANHGMELMAYEWSGRYNQIIMVDWTRLETEADITAFALKLAGHQRTTDKMPTAVGYALGFAANQFNRLPSHCLREVIDVAGDGIHNEGFAPAYAYQNFPFDGIVVNGLVIKGEQPDPEMFYRREVLRGPGAFLVIAKGFDDYARAMKEKLLKEVSLKNLSMVE